MIDLLREQIDNLEFQLDMQRSEKLEMQEKLFKLLRVPDVAQSTEFKPVRGVVSPAKQRATREERTRKEHFAAMAEQAKDLPEAITSKTTEE